jgi:hypothetical protein
MDSDNRVARSARTRLALASEADFGAVLDSLGELDLDGLAVAERDALLLERRRVLELDRVAIAGVRALGRRRPPAVAEAPEPARPAAASATLRAEQAFEQIGQIGRFTAGFVTAGTGIGGFEAAEPTAAAAPKAERRLGIALLVDLAAVILRALVLVGQQVVGARDLGEALRGLGIVLVAIRVKLLGELAIGLLDLGLIGARATPSSE